jgi:hypothetical protein
MANWQDVMGARQDAESALGALEEYAERVADGRPVAALLGDALGSIALVYELRALGTTIDYAATSICRATGRE